LKILEKTNVTFFKKFLKFLFFSKKNNVQKELSFSKLILKKKAEERFL
jgi:hypothetical protein